MTDPIAEAAALLRANGWLVEEPINKNDIRVGITWQNETELRTITEIVEKQEERANLWYDCGSWAEPCTTRDEFIAWARRTGARPQPTTSS